MDKIQLNRIPLQPAIRPTFTPKQVASTKNIFSQHLQDATVTKELKISKHANERLSERNIHISDAEWQLVSDKVFEARSKGVKESLVLMDQAALIVSATNATVITAMGRVEAKNQLFTNIDGTIVLN